MVRTRYSPCQGPEDPGQGTNTRGHAAQSKKKKKRTKQKWQGHKRPRKSKEPSQIKGNLKDGIINVIYDPWLDHTPKMGQAGGMRGGRNLLWRTLLGNCSNLNMNCGLNNSLHGSMSHFPMLIIFLWLCKRMNVFVLREHTLKCLLAKEELYK